MSKINISEAFAILQDHKEHGGGKVFSTVFIKKDGTVREMLCRFGVKGYLKGGKWANGHAGKPEHHWLAIVFDMKKKSYRSVPVDRLRRIKIDGQEYEVEANDNEQHTK